MASTTPSRDPHCILLPRDGRALAFVAQYKQVTQPQVGAAIFPDVNEAAVSRWLTRMQHLGLATAARFNRTGQNLIRLTIRGSHVLIAEGLLPLDEIFVASKPIAISELRHHTWIVDCRVALGLLDPTLVVEPAWRIQRRNGSAELPVPDLLTHNPKRNSFTAFEIDTGSESVVFLREKLQRLVNEIALSGIVVLTQGPSRIKTLERGIVEDAHDVPIDVLALPTATGRKGVEELAQTLGS